MWSFGEEARMARLIVLSVVVLLGAAGRAAGQEPTSAARQIDGIFAAFVGDATPGCAVGVSRAGQPVLQRAYGMADLEHAVPNAPETVFEPGSVTKQFTAAAVVLLALEGRLSFDDDVRLWIPEVPDYGTPITIRHLLNHTSGLRDWGSVAGFEGWPRTSRVHTHAHVLDIVSRQRALNYTPGQHYSYTNTGFNLLAMVVERVSGMSLGEFTKRRLFEPLGLVHTQWRDDYTRVVPGRAVGYQRSERGFRQDMPFENVYGNGGLLTTVGDLLRWTQNLETGDVGGARFLEEMHRTAVLNDGRPITYASGLVVSRYRGLREVSHSGSTAGYRGYLSRYPDQGVAVAVLCNAAHANPTTLAHAVADVYLGSAVADAGAATDGGARVELPSAALSARAGLYRNTRNHDALGLVVSNGTLRTDADSPVAVEPRSATSFSMGRSRLDFQGPATGAGRSAFLLTTPDGDVVRFEAVEAFAATAASLAEYAGVFRSDEAEATYTMAVEGGRLVLKRRFGKSAELTPLYRDVFEGDGGRYRFVRDASGRVTELSAIADRVWDLRFRRVTSGTD
jgi:CubicO group peptidase (beta-lactamase class C family)